MALTSLLIIVLLALAVWRDHTSSSHGTGQVRRSSASAVSVAPNLTPVLAVPRDANDISRDRIADADRDPFRVISFLPPPPKLAVTAPPPLEPPKPVAPPFPYRYFGRMVNIDGKVLTYLRRDNVIIPIVIGEVFDNAYRVDSITDQQIVVRYVPLDITTSIAARSVTD